MYDDVTLCADAARNGIGGPGAGGVAARGGGLSGQARAPNAGTRRPQKPRAQEHRPLLRRRRHPPTHTHNHTHGLKKPTGLFGGGALGLFCLYSRSLLTASSEEAAGARSARAPCPPLL